MRGGGGGEGKGEGGSLPSKIIVSLVMKLLIMFRIVSLNNAT